MKIINVNNEANWQPLEPAEVDNSKLPELLRENDVWMNNIYTVFVRKVHVGDPRCPEMWWLSIKRNDKEPCRDWRHFQWIKNQLCGPECEGVEIFPAESRLVDGSNQYHMWVFVDTHYAFPFGFNDGRNVSRQPLPGGKQRPFPENMLPSDIQELEEKADKMMKEYLNQ